MKSRSYTDRTLKLLWGRAAGRCAVPNCRIELYIDKTEDDPIVAIGDIAHLHSHANSGPRADVSLVTKQRNEYENLILLCKNCHARLDGQKNENTIERIRQLKENHEAWVRASLPERGRSRMGWKAVVIEDQWPVDALNFDAALSPDYLIGNATRINVSLGGEDWFAVAEKLRGDIQALLQNGDPFEKRIALFPLARVSACIYAGYVLTNRPNVELFQYHRDNRTWAWPSCGIGEIAQISVTGTTEPEHVFFAFDLTARINLEPLIQGLAGIRIIHIGVPSPSSRWLQHREQLRQLGITARDAFEETLSISSPSTMWHVIYAGPAPGAVKVGQQLSPTMTPKTLLYEYIHPHHVQSLTIENHES